jgi:hypothetical protein
MIMQGKTPRSLSWAGFLAVVGLGVLLLPVQAQTSKSDTAQKIEMLKQEIKALEQKQRAEKDADTANKKASAEEIAKARKMVEVFGREAEAKHKEWQEAMARQKKAMAHLAQLEGKHVVTWGEDGKTLKLRTVYEVADGKLGEKALTVNPHIVTLPLGKVMDGQHAIIVRTAPEKDGEARIIIREEGDGRIIIRATPDVEYKELQRTIEDAKAKINATGKGRIVFEADSPKLEGKPGAKVEDKRVIQFRLAAPDTKTAKPGEKADMGKSAPYGIQLKTPGDGKPGEKVYRYELKKPVESIYRYEVKSAKPGAKSGADDRTADLEMRLERLQKEIADLKDALKKNR